MSRVFLLLCFLGSSTAAFADNAQIGREIYHDNCATCHGREMQKPGLAFDLKKFPRDDFQRFQNSVLNGKGSGMPAWNAKLNQEDVQSLWEYVLTGSDSQ